MLGLRLKAQNGIFIGPCHKSIPSGADWFIVGHRVETNVDGEKVVKNAMIDGEVWDGKFYRFFCL